MNWYALYTKPRREIKVAEQLNKLGFTTYLPLKVEIKQWSDRKKKVVTPMFSSYVFIQIEEAKRNEIFAVEGILNYVFWLGKPAIISDFEMQLMKREVELPNQSIEVEALQPGERIKLKEGFFKDQMAIVEHSGKQKVHLFLIELGVKLIIERNSLL